MDPNNGCEANLTSASACGACGNVCVAGGPTPNCVLTGSTYKCQAQITTANEVDATATANSVTFTHPLIGNATNRMILVAVVSESQGNGIAGSRPDSVTYGGTAMTLAAEQPSVNVMGSATGTCTAACAGGFCYDWWGPDHFVYVLTESGIGSKTNNQTVIVNAATAPSPDRIIVNLTQLNGVRQATPISAFNGGFLGTCAMADPSGSGTIAPIVSMATTGSRIYSFASALWMNGTPTLTVAPSTGLTINDHFSSGAVSDMRAFFRYVTASTGLIPAAGNFTASFMIPDLGRMTHLAVVVHPAQAP